MKFKLVFILFNAVILISFLAIFFMPFLLLGWEYTREFWSGNWYLPLLFIAVLGVLNGYFVMNWKMFSFLEKEDWKGIIELLSEKAESGRISKQQLRILINAFLVSSDIDGITRIESIIREKKPHLLHSFAVSLGLPYLLRSSENPEAMESYYQEFLNIKGPEQLWVIWIYCFALLMLKKKDEAKERLEINLPRVKESVLYLLYLYLLDAFSQGDEDIQKKLQEGKEKLRLKYSDANWIREIEKNKSNIQVVILGKIVHDASSWMYPDSTYFGSGK